MIRTHDQQSSNITMIQCSCKLHKCTVSKKIMVTQTVTAKSHNRMFSNVKQHTNSQRKAKIADSENVN